MIFNHGPHTFVKDYAYCIDCNKKIKFTLPYMLVVFWTPLCPKCDDNLQQLLPTLKDHDPNVRLNVRISPVWGMFDIKG